jgi:uncharacterized protein YdaU (DUF1376 family)
LIPVPKRVPPSPAAVSFQGVKRRVMHYYQFNIGDYQSHTSHLSDIEDLVYRRLLDWYYLHECPIPLDESEVSRQIRMRSHTESIAIVLQEYFERTDNGWIHHRANKEIAKADEKSEKASASAKARWSKKDANALPTQSDSNATHNTLPNTQDTLPNTQKNKRGSRLTQDWFLTRSMGEWALQERPDIDVRQVAEQFKDYWIAQPGQKGVKLDWDATWRNWVRNTKALKANPADIGRLTVPSKNEPNLALLKIEEDAKKAVPIPLEVLAKMAELRRKA